MTRWYAAYTAPRHEKTVVEHLRYKGVENFLPLYQSLHRWKNRTVAPVTLPIFPGYLFVRIQRRHAGLVLGAPGIVHLVGVPGQPIPISDGEIEALRRGVSQKHAEPHPFLHAGQRVRVRRGPLEGLEGVLVQKKQQFRFVLSMDLIMKSMSVEVDAADVEPISSAYPNLQRVEAVRYPS